jgi:hypothetical protein
MDRWTDVRCKELGGRPPNHPAVCRDGAAWDRLPCPGGYTRCPEPFSGQCVEKGEEEQCWESSRAACPKELQCMKEGLAVCLDPLLRCDMHPQCDKGEDEEECEAEYRRRGYLDSSAIMRCESPHHNSKSDTPTVKIWAAPCDGREECFEGLDERGCDTGFLVNILLGAILGSVRFGYCLTMAN